MTAYRIVPIVRIMREIPVCALTADSLSKVVSEKMEEYSKYLLCSVCTKEMPLFFVTGFAAKRFGKDKIFVAVAELVRNRCMVKKTNCMITCSIVP